MTFGVVPAGKRLVIEHFSAQIYNNTGGPPFHAKLIAEAASTSWFPIRSIQMNRTWSIPTPGCMPTPGKAYCSRPISTAKDIWRLLFPGTSFRFPKVRQQRWQTSGSSRVALVFGCSQFDRAADTLVPSLPDVHERYPRIRSPDICHDTCCISPYSSSCQHVAAPRPRTAVVRCSPIWIRRRLI